MDISTIDIIMLSIILISTLTGWFRGATKELFTLVSWIGSAYLTIKLFPIGRSIIQNFVTQPLLSDIITGIVIFILFLVILSTVSYLFSNLVKNSLLNIPDKICGCLFGAVRGIFILVCVDFGLTNFISDKFVQNSQLHSHLQQITRMTFVLLPESIQQTILNYISPDKQKELISNFKIPVKPNFAQQQLEDKIKNRSDVKSAEELSKLQVKKSKNGDQEIIEKTHKELDNLLSQIR